MEKRRFMKRNEGYSLTELIIVMAIIAILTGVAMVTVTIIHSAKAKEASSTLEDALSELEANAKGKMCVVADVEQPDYRFALAIYKDGNKYYVKKGYYKGNGLAKDDPTSYEFVDSENVGSGKGTTFSTYVRVTYVDSSGTEHDITGIDDKPAFIIFDRQGMCDYGDGQYKFYRSNTNSNIGTVTLNKNGSHSADN